MTADIKMLPCPFCGGQPYMQSDSDVEALRAEAIEWQRQEVEALVREIEEGCREHSCTPHDMSIDVEGDTLAALCRAWLALDAGAPAIMDTREALSVCAPTEDDFPALYALQGQRVRIVKEVG